MVSVVEAFVLKGNHNSNLYQNNFIRKKECK